VTVSTVIAVSASLVGVSPIRVLFVASIIGGLASPIGLVALVATGSDSRIMCGAPLRGALRVAGWLVAGVITLLSIGYLVQQAIGGGLTRVFQIEIFSAKTCPGTLIGGNGATTAFWPVIPLDHCRNKSATYGATA
jgi:hypothetical protein